ncbi:MAG: 3-dehydroquinate synthase [Deltaproteobacteria bacterium]|nr:3-dehydroquinate synthase [Deltaproteobacteria bacterium]
MTRPTVIRVTAGPDRYPVVVTRGRLSALAAWARVWRPCRRAVIVSHRGLRRRFGSQLQAALRASGLQVGWCLIPEGERSKSLDMVARLYAQCAAQAVDRQTLLVSLGGGVVGDIAGFVAATYLRGLPWVAVPTTLVAQLDSAIGGKVGVNLPSGKNLVGAFYQPWLVYCDLHLLRTLPPERWREGLVEALKCGIVADPTLFRVAQPPLASRNLLSVVCRAARVKARLVAQDPYDRRGMRAWLNLGHTIGHALERAGGYRQWSHGAAVAAGLRAAARLSIRWGYCDAAVVDCVETALDRLHMRRPLPRLARNAWERLLRGEKKRSGETVHFVVMRAIGQVAAHPITIRDLATAITDL